MTNLLPLAPIAAIAWIGTLTTLSVVRLRRSGMPLIPRVPADATFAETACSGRSLLNLQTRFGGARGVLIASVAGGRLRVIPRFPFNLIAGTYDLDVDVPLSAVTSIERTRRLTRRILRIAFGDERAPIELRVGDERSLLSQFPSRTVMTGERDAAAARPMNPSPMRLALTRGFLALWGGMAIMAIVLAMAGGHGIPSRDIAPIAIFTLAGVAALTLAATAGRIARAISPMPRRN